MTASEQLNSYLDRFGRRLQRLYVARGTAILALTILLMALLAGWFSIDAGFASGIVNLGRILLLLAAVAVIYLLFHQPIKHLKQNRISEIESRTPDLEGRVETFSQVSDKNNPFRELLAEDALSISNRTEPEHNFHHKEFNLPWGIAIVSLIILIWMTISGPGLMNYSLRNLFGGWLFSGLTPPQTISVSPGDQTVRVGGNFEVTASMDGFSPDRSSIFIQVGDKDWQEVEMVHVQDDFHFTFFSIREPMHYYVMSTGIRSPEYQVDVIQLPNVQSIFLTYTYPDWTGKDPDSVEFGGDIRAVKDTKIAIQVNTSAPLPYGVLILNDEEIKLTPDGTVNSAEFSVLEDGDYYIAANIGGDLVRLSDDYFISLLDDERPDIQFTRPGRDWNASPIEEVTTRIKVKDDYALKSLQLKYAINGGDWQTVDLPVDDSETDLDHVFLLESMMPENNNTDTATELSPGDLIAYYAEARDRLNASRTDMFFIELQAFDRRYTQSQMAGGGGGGGENPQQEISRRQKEIIVSTWNLIREQTEKQEDDVFTVNDNAILLSELQTSLAEQSQTLADRTRARQLTNTDESIRNFVEHMEMAAESMRPAAEHLAEIDLEKAIQPEQEALQHLLRAEAMFNDIEVSFNQGSGGGGGQAGRDLADMFELEMDMEKNQYETGSQASQQQAQQETDELMRDLEDLARRQEQLANNLNRQEIITEAQRWQQEMLRREAEELQRRLQQQQDQQQQGQQASSSSSSSQQSASQSSGQTSGQSESQPEQQSRDQEQSELDRRLSSAIRAMNDASEAMQNNPGSEEQQRATQEARRQLQEAQDQLAQAQQQNMQDAFRQMASEADTLHRRQTRLDNAMNEGAQEALSQRETEDDRVENPLTYEEEQQLAGDKRALLADLQRLRQEMERSARDYRQDSPRAARELDDAGADLRESEIDTRLNLAASYIEQGAFFYVVGSESIVTEALRKLSDQLRRADALVNDRNGKPGERSLSEALAQARILRRDLQQLLPGQGSEPAETPSSQQGAQSDQQAQNAGQQSARSGRNGGTGGSWTGWDAWRGSGGIQPEQFERLREEIAQTSQLIAPLIPELREQGLDQREISEIYALLRQLPLEPAGGEKNTSIIQAEVTHALSLLEQLELKLEQGIEGEQSDHVRSEVSEPVPEAYQDAVAEYYRRLSRD